MKQNSLERAVSNYGMLVKLIRASKMPTSEKEEVLNLAGKVIPYDPLTGLLRKEFLEERLKEEASKAKRHKLPLSVIMADIDDFKKYNDTYGQKQGDYALAHIGELLKLHRRKEDIIGRYGGEEFLLVLPHVSKESAKVVEDVVNSIRSAKLKEYVGLEEVRDKKYLGNKGFQDLTISAGMASYPFNTKNLEELERNANKAMRQAKENGKDTFVIYL